MASTGKRSTRSTNAANKSGKRSDTRSLALGTLSIGAVAGAIAATAFGLLKLGKRTYVSGAPLSPPPMPKPAPTPADGPTAANTAATGGTAEHVPTDLMGDAHPGFEDRAIDAFRPDPTAPIPEGERDAFRPALAGASAPTLVKGEARENERLDAAPS
jgi:hypothetical protein